MWLLKIRLEEVAAKENKTFIQYVEYINSLGMEKEWNLDSIYIGERDVDNEAYKALVSFEEDKMIIMTLRSNEINGSRFYERDLYEIKASEIASIKISDKVDFIGNAERSFRIMFKNPIIFANKPDDRCDSMWLLCAQNDYKISKAIGGWINKFF